MRLMAETSAQNFCSMDLHSLAKSSNKLRSSDCMAMGLNWAVLREPSRWSKLACRHFRMAPRPFGTSAQNRLMSLLQVASTSMADQG